MSAGLATSTVTPGNTDPVESLTTLAIVAFVTACPIADDGMKRAAAMTRTTTGRVSPTRGRVVMVASTLLIQRDLLLAEGLTLVPRAWQVKRSPPSVRAKMLTPCPRALRGHCAGRRTPS